MITKLDQETDRQHLGIRASVIISEVQAIQKLCRWAQDRIYDFWRWSFNARARLSGQKIGCRALTSNGRIRRISVNCDGSISCCQRDMDGAGQLGNVLTVPRFEDVWHDGERSMMFQRSFEQGKVPIPRCLKCHDLVVAGSDKDEQSVIQERDEGMQEIDVLSIENTVICNYECLFCIRSLILSKRIKTELSLMEYEKVLKMFSKHIVKQINLYAWGEPTLSKRFPEELALVRKYYPKSVISVSTNGVGLENEQVRKALINYGVDTFISLPGTSQTFVDIYQKGVCYEKVVENMVRLVKYRDETNSDTRIYWLYVVFCWNDTFAQMDELVARARDVGVDGILISPAKSPMWGVSWRFMLNKKRYAARYHMEPWDTGSKLFINVSSRALRNPDARFTEELSVLSQNGLRKEPNIKG